MLRTVASRCELQLENARLVSGGFSGAEVFQATTVDGRTLAFRKTPQHVALQDERLRALHRLLMAVWRSGMTEIPVPFVPGPDREAERTDELTSLVGNSTTANRDPWVRIESDLWQVEPWMPGSPLRGNAVTPERLRSALERLHSFHSAAAEHVAVGNRSGWFRNSVEPSPAILRRRDIAGELLKGQLQFLKQHAARDPDSGFHKTSAAVFRVLDDRLSWLHRELTRLADQLFSIQPVLRDVWRAHVLFTADRVTGLIDLTAAATDHVAVDFVRLFRSWFGMDTGRLIGAVTELASQQSFNQAEWQLLRALDASSVLLSPLTWIRRRAGAVEREACPAEMLTRFEEVAAIAQAFEPLPARQ